MSGHLSSARAYTLLDALSRLSVECYASRYRRKTVRAHPRTDHRRRARAARRGDIPRVRRSKRSQPGRASPARRCTSTSARDSASSMRCAKRSTPTRRSLPSVRRRPSTSSSPGSSTSGPPRRRFSPSSTAPRRSTPRRPRLVERQRNDRNGEVRRGSYAASAFATVPLRGAAVLTSFETYRELRGNAGLSRRGVTTTLQESARRAAPPQSGAPRLDRASRAVATSTRNPSGSEKNVA